MDKEPKFFCDYCKSEVRKDAMICPHCGHFFASVRCPACGFTGTHKDFKKGCPACGYAVGSSHNHGLSNTAKKEAVSVPKVGTNDSLPWWIYMLVCCLAGITLMLFFFI